MKFRNPYQNQINTGVYRMKSSGDHPLTKVAYWSNIFQSKLLTDASNFLNIPQVSLPSFTETQLKERKKCQEIDAVLR